MSDGEVNFVSKDAVKFCDINGTDQRNGKRSFLVTVDDNGKVEVNPKDQALKESCDCQQSKRHLKMRKASRTGKQRIRIALIEEEADSSDEDQDVTEDKNDVVCIDAQSFEAMQDRFIKIYNKNLRGKPSFVVLEDALVRKRIEDTLQDHYSRNTCHCHAQQQTSPCDIGAHTGSQTDEFLLQYALRSQIKGHSRGCQATDVNIQRPQTSTISSTSKRNLHVPYLRRLNQLHLGNQSDATATSNSAPSVTISFAPPTAATVSAVVQPQQPLQQQLLLPTTTQSHAHCCSSICACGNCNNCCLQLPPIGNSNYCLPATNSNCTACFVKQQQQHQQQQQQHPGMAATCDSCHGSCCLLRPTSAQTTLGYCMPGYCSQQMLSIPEASTQQPRQDYPNANWTSQYCNQCPYLAAFGLPHCASCHMAQQQLHQQHVSLADSSCMNNNYSSLQPTNSTISEAQFKSEIQKLQESMELNNSVSSSKSAGTCTNEKIDKKARHKTPSSKLYMARFGRTCLILKPTVASMPPRLPTKPTSRTTSNVTLPQK